MNLDCSAFFQKIQHRHKTTLLSTFVIGLIAHGMALFNKFSVFDDVLQYSVGATYTSGRWMLGLLEKAERMVYGDGSYSLPVFNGLLAFLFIALSACFVVSLLGVQDEIICVFIAGLMVCFPVITSIFGYMFTAHCYMLGLLFGVLGAYCICEYKKRRIWFLGIFFIASSVGIYQAFLPFALTLILMYLMNLAINVEDIKAVIKEGVQSLGAILLSMLVYFGMNRAALAWKHLELSSYKGINTVGKIPAGEYLSRMVDAYREYFQPDIHAWYCMYPGHLIDIYKAVMALNMLLSVLLMVRLVRRKKHWNAIVLLVLLALFPLFVNLIFVMTEPEQVHSLMVYPQLLPFCLFLLLLQNTEIKITGVRKRIVQCSAILLALILMMYCRVDNKCYLKAAYAQQEAIRYFTTLITRIQAADGYRDEYPVAFLNEENNSADASFRMGDKGMLGSVRYYPYFLDAKGYVDCYTWKEFMWQWCGYRPEQADAEQFSELEEVKNMPHYPDQGSIKIIDETVIVNF